MTPLEAEIVHKKLAVIQENLEALEPTRLMAKDEYLQAIHSGRCQFPLAANQQIAPPNLPSPLS